MSGSNTACIHESIVQLMAGVQQVVHVECAVTHAIASACLGIANPSILLHLLSPVSLTDESCRDSLANATVMVADLLTHGVCRLS
jgi:hypothetical protein